MKKFLFIFLSVGILQQTYTMEEDDIQQPAKKAKYVHIFFEDSSNSSDSNESSDEIDYLNQKTDINSKFGPFGETALIHAIHNFDKDKFYSLLEQGADINACDNSGKTPLYIALNNNHIMRSNFFDIEKDFLKRGANPNAKQRDHSLLHKAVEIGDIDSIKLLIKYGAQINEKSTFVGTPLKYAIVYRSEKVIKELCNRGVQLNNIDNYGSNAFHVAIEKKLSKKYINLLVTNSRFDSYNKEVDEQLKATVKTALLVFNKLSELGFPKLPKEIQLIIFSDLGLNCCLDGFNGILLQQLIKIDNKNAKNILHTYTDTHVNCLEQILQSKNNEDKTALQVLRDKYKNNYKYIQKVEPLVNVEKLRKDRIDFMNGSDQDDNLVVQIHKHAKNLLEW